MTELPRLRVGLTLDSATFVRETNKVIDAVNRMSSELQRQNSRMARSFEGMERGISNLSRSMTNLGRLFQVGSFSLLARQTALTADSFTVLGARLQLFTGSAKEAVTVQQALIDISNRNRVSIQSSADLYTRLALTLSEVGVTSEQLLAITDTVGQTLKISGSSGASAAAGLIQFAQAMGSGVLRGDELRSVMEQLPGLAVAIANGLGITVGELRKLGKEGALTTDLVLNTLLKQAPQIEEQYKKIPITVGDSFTLLRNALAEMVGDTDQATSASGKFAAEIAGLAAIIRSPGFIEGFHELATVVLRELRREFELLADIIGFFKTTLQDLGVVGRSVEELNDEIASLEANREALAKTAQAAGIAPESTFAIQQANELIDSLKRQRDAMVSAAKSGEQLEVSIRRNVPPIRMLADDSNQLTDEMKRLDESRKKAVDDLRFEIAMMQRLIAAQQQGEEAYKAEQIAIEGLTAARRVGLDLTTEEGVAFAELAANLADLTMRREEDAKALEGEKKRALDEWQKTMDYIGKQDEFEARMDPIFPEEKELSEPFKNALEDIQGMFTDTFQDLTKGAITDFEDMATQVTDIFSRMSANIATLSLSPRLEDQRAFKELAESIHVSVRGLQALALAPSILGTAIGALGGQQATQGANFGMGIGSALGAGLGLIPGFPGGPVIGSMFGGLGGQALGGLFGGLFGDENRGRVQMPRGGLGLAGSGGTGQAAEFVRTLDRRLIELMDARQELLIDEALRQAPGVQVKFQEKLSSGDMMRLAAGRIGPAAGALGFNVAGVTGGTAEEQFANLQRALELLSEIEALKIGPIATQFRDLNTQFASMAEEAGRLGIALDALPEAHRRAAEALERQIRSQRISVGELVGHFSPLDAALRQLEVQMQQAAADATALGIPLTNITAKHQQMAAEIVRQFEEAERARTAPPAAPAAPEITAQQRIATALQVGGLRPIDAALRTLQANMQDAAAEAVKLGISTRSVAAEHRRLADELLREHRAAQTSVAERVGALDPITSSLRLLEIEMQSAAAEASRLGVSTAAVREQHKRLADELLREHRAAQANVAQRVGALDPLNAALRLLEIEMQQAAFEASRLGVSTASVRLQHQRLAEEQIRDFRLQQISAAERVGALTPLNAALESLWIEMQKAAFEASRLGVSTANVAQEHKRLADEIIRQHEAQIDALALSIIEPFERLRNPLTEFSRNLEVQLLNPLGQMSSAAEDFRRIAALAQGGDIRAIEQFQSASERFIEEAGRFGASPAQVAAIQEVANANREIIGKLDAAQREASAGVEGAIRLAQQRNGEKLDVLASKLDIVAEEVKRLQRAR